MTLESRPTFNDFPPSFFPNFLHRLIDRLDGQLRRCLPAIPTPGSSLPGQLYLCRRWHDFDYAVTAPHFHL